MSDYLEQNIHFNGKDFMLKVLSGVVIKTSTRSDTHVSGSGSSSAFGGYGGGSTQISSTVEITQDFWIKGESGKEYRVQVKNADADIREGNLVYVGAINNENVVLHNQATNNGWFLGSHTFLFNSFWSRFWKLALGMTIAVSVIWEVIFRFKPSFILPMMGCSFIGSIVVSFFLLNFAGSAGQKPTIDSFRRFLGKEFMEIRDKIAATKGGAQNKRPIGFLN